MRNAAAGPELTPGGQHAARLEVPWEAGESVYVWRCEPGRKTDDMGEERRVESIEWLCREDHGAARFLKKRTPEFP